MADEYTPIPSGLPEEDEPLTASSDTMVNVFGEEMFTIGDPELDEGEEAPIVAGLGFTPGFQSILTSGVYNNDFAAGPPNPAGTIETANPLPYWRFVNVQGGSITAKWVADTDAPSGYALQWTISNAAADDEAYIEQIVPVSVRLGVIAPEVRMGQPSSAQATTTTYIETEPLYADGTSAATARRYSPLWVTSTTNQHQVIVGLPPKTRFLRIRIGTKTSSGFTGTYTRNVQEVWAGQPNIAWVTLIGSDINLPATGSQIISLVSVSSTGTPTNGTERFVAPFDGFVQSISVRASDTILGAGVDFSVYSATDSAIVGPEVRMGVGEQNVYEWGRFDITDNHFEVGEVIRFQANVPSGTLTSVGRDTLLIATLGLFTYSED